MKILIASVSSRLRVPASEGLARVYLERVTPYCPIEGLAFRDESGLLNHVAKMRTRTSPLLLLLDSRGKMLSSEQFASWLGAQRDEGRQAIVFAIGPADGWSELARSHASMLLSFGPMTLPHELMRVVLAEQVYRAFTILAGHPYHSGHLG